MKKLMFCLTFFMSLNFTYAQLSREWTRVYDYKNQDNYGYQVIQFQNYIYVFGHTLGTTLDYQITKYTMTGDVVWAKAYDVIDYFQGSLFDNFVKAAIDDNGNLYVTGISTKYPADFDIGIIKVSPDGDLLWSGVYLGGNGDEGPTDIKVVSDGILLIGTSPLFLGYSEMLVLKISFNGSVMAEQRFIRDLYTNNGGGSVCISNNDIYVAGWSRAPESYDIALIKYNWGLGGETWRRIYDNSNDNSKGYDVVSDDNYVYVIGSSGAFSGSIPILKYDFNGNLVWSRFHQITTAEINLGPKIKLDDDNIYVIYDNFSRGKVFKYNKNGDLLWDRTQGGTALRNQYISFDMDDRYIFVCGGEGIFGTVTVYDLNGNIVYYEYEEDIYSTYYNIIKSNNNIYTTGTVF